MNIKRIPLIAGNWKMNTTVAEAKVLVSQMLPDLQTVEAVEILICPPFISLFVLHELLKGTAVKLGAQNVFYAEKEAFTGEISPLMLQGICEYVIIGHSERRQYFNETGELINKKLMAAFNAGLKPVLCVGEKLEENESGKTKEVIFRQLEEALSKISHINGIVIAYEPVWAIGTGRAATATQANETIGFIRQALDKLYYGELGEKTRILYGGSVTRQNIAELMQQTEIDGALVGGASLKADEFVDIIKQTSVIKR